MNTMTVSTEKCDICGCFPCMGICPNNDPFGGDQQAENDDYEAGAKADYEHELRDAYYGEDDEREAHEVYEYDRACEFEQAVAEGFVGTMEEWEASKAPPPAPVPAPVEVNDDDIPF